MDNFKELAEKVLAGRISGTFILKNGDTLSSELLRMNYKSDSATYEFELGDHSYNNRGWNNVYFDSPYDIIRFIEDKTMDNKRNVAITLEKAREWYKQGGELKEVALQAFSKDELKYNKPKSWNEYCMLMKCNGDSGYVIMGDSRIRIDSWRMMNNPAEWKSTLPPKELAEAFLALMQLMSLRKSWVGDWEPMKSEYSYGDYITNIRNHDRLGVFSERFPTSLSFPNISMAEEFFNCFKDLIEVAKPLI